MLIPTEREDFYSGTESCGLRSCARSAGLRQAPYAERCQSVPAARLSLQRSWTFLQKPCSSALLAHEVSFGGEVPSSCCLYLSSPCYACKSVN